MTTSGMSSSDLLREAKAAAGTLGPEPQRHLAIVTCMDARVDPWRIFDVRVGDVHVMRNAGGLVTDDVLRSLIVSQHKLGTTRIDVMMHTTCGMLGFDDEGFRRELEAEAGGPVGMRFGGFADLEAELRRGVETLRSTPLLPHRDAIRGFVYDITSGRRSLVVDAEA